MPFVELLLIAVGLAMDAFAVSIGKGLLLQRTGWRRPLLAGLWFGGFQALMPLVGYFLGVSFAAQVERVDHWIAFLLLAYIGGKMIWESRADACSGQTDDFSPRTMFLLAVATSIDALAVGVSFAFLGVDIYLPVAVIGVVTLLFSVVGVALGRMLGCRFRQTAARLGGVVLILIGTKILIEHLLGL